MSRTRSISLFRKNLTSRRAQAAIAAAMLAVGSQAQAGIPGLTNQYANPSAGDWTNPANWSFGLAPTYADNTGVAQGTATVATGDNAQDAFIAIDSTGAMSVTGGTLTSISDIRSGNVAGDNATFTQSGGAVTVIGRGGLWAAQLGTGTVTLSGGTTTVGAPFAFGDDYGDVLVGNGAGSVGTLNINGGTLTNYALVIPGRGGATGNITMTSGTWNMGGDFGHSTGTGKVTINQSGGTINVGTFIAYPRASAATLIGSFQLGIGNTLANKSVYTMSGSAQLNVNAHMYVGGTAGTNPSFTSNAAGFADLVMNGGTITLGNANNQTGVLFIGNSTTTASATGTVTLNGSASITAPAGVVIGQRAAGTGSGNGTGTLTINSGQVLTPKASVTIGRVSSATQGGNGTLTLAGGLLQANSIIWVKPTGATPTQVFNWTGGQLNINSAQADYVMVNNGGTLAPGVSAPGAFTLTGVKGSYTQATSGTLALDFASDSSYDSINAAGGTEGAINLAGNVNTTLGSGYSPAYGAAYQVLTGKTISDTATWHLPTLPTGLTWTQQMISEGGNALELLAVAPSTTTPLAAGSWTGPGSVDAGYTLSGAGGSVSVDANVTAGYLQVGGTGNWSLDGASTLTFSASSGRAGLTAFGNTTTINAPISFAGSGAISTASAGTNVTVNGTISGGGTLTKTGPGTLVLKNTGSTFSGTWAVTAGTLNIDSDANLGAPGAHFSVAGANVNVTNAWNSARAIALQGSGTTVTVGADSTLTGNISGTGGLTKNGANALVISGANTYSGATTISNGTLTLGAANTIPSSPVLLQGASSVVATLNLNGNSQSLSSLATIGASGVVSSVTTGGADLTVGSDNTSTVFRGNIDGGGNGTFTKTGTGLFEIAGAAAPVGSLFPNVSINTAAIHVAGGILQYDNLAPGRLALPSVDSITVDTGASISLGAASPAVVNSVFTGGGGIQFHGGSVELAGGDSDYTGNTELRFGSSVLLDTMGALGGSTAPVISQPVTVASTTTPNSNSLVFEIDGTFSKPLIINAPAALSLNATGVSVTLDHGASGNGSLNYTGGNFLLTAANTNDSATAIGAGVTVQLGLDNALSSKEYSLISGTLDLNGFNQTLGAIVGANTGKIILSSGKTLTVGADNRDANGLGTTNTGYAGVLTGAGALTKIGGGLALMAPASTGSPFTGPTEVQMGALRWDMNSRTLNSTSAITIDAHALMIFNFTTAGSGATTPIISVPIGGAGTVEKDGTDPLILSGTNSYTGGTRISAGTLRVSADNNLGAAPASVSPSNIVFPGAGTLQFTTAFNPSANRGISLVSTGTVDTNSFNIAIAGPIAGAGGFTKAGLGNLTVNNITSGGTIAVNAGNLNVLAQGSTVAPNKAAAVTVAVGSQLDLTDNKLIITTTTVGAWNSTAYTGVLGQIATGRSGGTWSGSSIVTSMTAANPAHQLTTLAVATASSVGKTTFGGVPVNPTDTLVMYTYAGDANLDGKINADDYFQIDSHYGTTTNSAISYLDGDFNYDGAINGDDYFLIDQNFHSQGAPISNASPLAGVSAVPEPASIALLSLGAMSILLRRRRHQ